MSRWATDLPEEITGSSTTGSQQIPWWIRVFPFVLSALFFLSAFFSIFAPLPILLTYFRFGRKWAWLAALTNSALVLIASGGLSLAVYLIFIVSLALLMPELIRPKATLGRIAGVTLLGMGLAGAVGIVAYSQIQGVNPWVEFKSQVSSSIDFLTTSLPPAGMPTDEGERAEWKKQVLIEFPSVVVVFSLLLVWANLVILLRANPEGIREKAGFSPAFAREWRAPEALLWMTIAAGGLIVIDMYQPLGAARDVALNVFRVLMAVYAIQGLSILAYLFETWNIRGFFRVAAMMAAVFLMMPLLLSLGFFDQLFDFRSRIRQS